MTEKSRLALVGTEQLEKLGGEGYVQSIRDTASRMLTAISPDDNHEIDVTLVVNAIGLVLVGIIATCRLDPDAVLRALSAKVRLQLAHPPTETRQ